MKFTSSVVSIALCAGTSDAFVAPSRKTFEPRTVVRKGRQTSLRMTFDPSSVQESFSSFLVAADEATNALLSPIDTTAPPPAVADSGNGWFGFLAGPIEDLISLIHSALTGVGMSTNAWGLSIVLLVVLIKVVTYPINKSQLENTSKMQVLSPKIKEIQAKYASNPEVMNQKVAAFYQENDFNPLAGCVPSLIQLPVFIGLYRAVSSLAKENALDESFLWLPSLEGPTYGADPTHGLDWITKGWVNGVPSLGWDDTAKFLSIPIVLVISQVLSQQLMAPPKSDDPSMDTTNQVLKFLPFMIGYFSLGVPSALGIYWVINNIITTGINLQIKSSIKMPEVAESSVSTTSTVSNLDVPTFEPINPVREKPSGFAAPEQDPSVVTPITSVDAEVIDIGVAPSGGTKKARGKKKKKRRN